MTAIVMAQFIVIVILIALYFPVFIYAVKIGKAMQKELPPAPLSASTKKIGERIKKAKLNIADKKMKAKYKAKRIKDDDANPYN